MARLTLIDPQTAQGPQKELLDAVKAKLGLVPNMTRGLANSPAALRAYLEGSGALGEGTLPARLREQIALVVGQVNECDYCVAAHATIGKMVGLTAQQIDHAVHGSSSDAKERAALQFALVILKNRGSVTDADVTQVREAGFGDGEITEIIANVALNVFTNYFNKAAQIDIDFPKLEHSH